jgi:hydroxymethylglutaryl-CoA lyase
MSQRDVHIVEVSARDGLQNDPAFLSTEQKVELVARTTAAGLDRAEVASFVNPKRVPQMADAEPVLEGLASELSPEQLTRIGLVLNVRGIERAVQTSLQEVNVVVVSTDTFAQRNQGQDTEGLIEVLRQVVPLAKEAGIKPTVTLAASFGCPFEGDVPIDRSVKLAEQCAEAGAEEIALADTIGVGAPIDVRNRFDAVRAVTGDLPLRAHFHNTRNTGYANALVAYEAGVTILDASLGGIGGCPFAPKATGNIATEDLVYLFERSGISTGVDLDALIEHAQWLQGALGHDITGQLSKAGNFPGVLLD